MKLKLLSLFTVIGACTLLNAQPFAAVQNIDPNTGEEPYEIASGDLDGDGDIDLVMATYNFVASGPVQDYIRWYSNDGNGNFTIEADVSTTIRYVDGLTVANIDNQNGLDIIATSAFSSELVYFLSNSSGGFDPQVLIDDSTIGLGEVVAGDINQDGNIDIACVAYNDNKTVWYSGDGAGNFTSEVDIENGTANGPYYMELADLDGDTDLDAIVGFFNTQTVEIYYNQNIESGSTAVTWIKDLVTLDPTNSSIFNITTGDVNNDGSVNVVVVDNLSGDVQWFEKIKDGASTANNVSTAASITRPAAAMVVDIDGDGNNDVVVTDGGTNSIAVVYFEGNSNADPNVTFEPIADNNFQMFDFTADDYDSDGDIDIAAIGNSADTTFWYENERIILGVSEFDSENLIIHPNPAKDWITFSGTFNQTLNITLYNTLGQNVLNQQISAGDRLDVSQLSKGVYVIKDINSNMTRKFVKN